MHSLTNCLLHGVFATQDREPVLTAEIQERLWPYLGGIAREHKITVLAVGGVEDHVHLLFRLPADLSMAKAMQIMKGNSSKWLHLTFPQLRDFAWQEGYAAFSIGASGVAATVKYIREQAEHHRTRTYREEVERFLARHGMEFELRMLD